MHAYADIIYLTRREQTYASIHALTTGPTQRLIHKVIIIQLKHVELVYTYIFFISEIIENYVDSALNVTAAAIEGTLGVCLILVVCVAVFLIR